MKIRLDQYLVQHGLTQSRERAKALIMSGDIFVNGEREDKPGTVFEADTAKIELHGKPLPYVSRGGWKLEKALRDQLQSYIDRKADEELKNDLLDQVCANARLSATSEQIARAVDREMKSLEGQLARQKLTLAAYAQFTGKTVEQLREDYLPDAKKNLLRQQVIAEIAQIEKIEADEQSVANAITVLCRENGMTIDQLQPYMTDEFQAAIVRSVITDKVLSLIQENAEITVVDKEA